MTKEKKLTLEELIEKADSAKKVNPLDLSSDQDLTIALMNLVSLEEHFFFSGAKTGKTGFYELINTAREMRKEMMERIVKKDSSEHGEVWCISKHLLAASMRLMEVGTKANSAGKKEDAYNLFNKAYDLYSLFWGLNMDLIDMSEVHEVTSTIHKAVIENPEEKETKPKIIEQNKKNETENGSFIKNLGDWVRRTVDCCIE
ncbi:MAG: hypothetical protein JW974_02350 [Alphaproteobacteria bacterium]|nr:hypothetical protein [Alphaproteobacteria bacterium]MBN2675259.1 hypothetical protein [Alphaproteobacteria bacterium]